MVEKKKKSTKIVIKKKVVVEKKKPPTNAEFASLDGVFNDACEHAGTRATCRQAGKWRRKVGVAYRLHTKTLHKVEREDGTFKILEPKNKRR